MSTTCKECENDEDYCCCESEPLVAVKNGDKIERIIPLSNLSKIAENIGFTTYRRDTVKGRIIDYLNKQTDKGVKKYGHTLDESPDEKHDWRLMMIEELVDCIQYQQKEIIRLERLLTPSDS
jgi:hypothetical protein